eukprot:comp20541_c0_seq1/m.41606 comp20541_c0_seq1/g.41606  ORF comp20541_c0_seq1/g.41606 comp20541_c0_seq1/m.41606 type:complete len:300 (-) comp20541_c0_seq1:85-984(-)
MALAISEQLLVLSRESGNRLHIARDNSCLHGLVSFLAHTDDAVVLNALEALGNLAQEQSNEVLLVEANGLVEGLRGIAEKWKDNSEARESAVRTLRKLKVAVDSVCESTEPQQQSSQHAHQPATTVTDGIVVYMHDIYTFQITAGADARTIERAESAVVCTRGVISVTHNNTDGTLTVTARANVASLEKLNAAFAKQNVSAQLLSHETGTSRRAGAASGSHDDRENDENQGGASNTHGGIEVDDRAGGKIGGTKHRPRKNQVTVTAEDCSLAARIEAEKKREYQKESKVNRFLSRFSFW